MTCAYRNQIVSFEKVHRAINKTDISALKYESVFIFLKEFKINKVGKLSKSVRYLPITVAQFYKTSTHQK